MTASVISATAETFRADPTAGRTSPAVTATLVDGRARLSAGSFTWESDLPASIGGTNVAPSPTAYLLGALAGCGVAFLRDTLAPEFGVRIEAITAVARCKADIAGLVGVPGTKPDLDELALEVAVSTPDPESLTAPMFEAWRRRCPIFLVLRNANEVTLSLSTQAA
jgi:uncharacterized OsmC-like protein